MVAPCTIKLISMMPIQMVDTQTQYQKIKTEIDSVIQEVINSSAFINGKIVQEFAFNLAKYLHLPTSQRPK
jgi:dTDP-4-amino-4,6-dideoxygalactose transaminase